VELRNLPLDTCPLCGQVALDRRGQTWSCNACGCRLAFDPRTRRAQITYFPETFAALESAVGGQWLTRQEMFARVAKAQQQTAQGEPAGMDGPLRLLAATTLMLLTAFSMLVMVAVAFILGPSMGRTRQIIAAAYQPTPDLIAMPTSTPTPASEVGTPAASPELTLDPTTTDSSGDAPVDTDEPEPGIPTPIVPTMEPPIATSPPPPSLDAVPPPPPDPRPVETLPPTFTPAPMPVMTLTDPLVSPLLPTATPETPTPTATPSPSPTAVAAAPESTATPVPPGSVVFRGSVRIRNIRAVGSEPAQGDEYVELQNEGTQQVNLAGWTLRAIRASDGAIMGVFVFPGNAVIAAGQICRIYTNLMFAPDNCGFSSGFLSPVPIWPDGGGAYASLFDPEGQEYTRFTY